MNYYRWKTWIDFHCAWVMLILCFPILVLVALMIKLEDSSGPIIFKQQRVGENEQLFTIYKFRSMSVETEKDGILLTDSERMLRIGRFIRESSIDELPQLVNVLKGDMSFIGPRPLLKEYLPYYTEKEKIRHHIKPGISGWAQVNGRNIVNWEEKFELDSYYVTHMSFVLDMKIIRLTIQKVFSGSDILDAGQETTQSFADYRINQQNSSHF